MTTHARTSGSGATYTGTLNLHGYSLHPIKGSTRPGRYHELDRAYKRLNIKELLIKAGRHPVNAKSGAEGR